MNGRPRTVLTLLFLTLPVLIGATCQPVKKTPQVSPAPPGVQPAPDPCAASGGAAASAGGPTAAGHTGNTVYVDDDFPNCLLADGSETAPFCTIQAAVDHANPGDTISIAAGTYAENVTINKQLVVMGADASSTIVDPLLPGPAMSITAGGIDESNRLVVSNLTTQGAIGDAGNTGTGIRFDGSTAISHVTLDGVVSTGNAGHGIAINHTGTMSDLVLANVNSSNNVSTGFRVPTSLVSLDGLQITGSDLDNNASGLEIYIASAAGNPQAVSNVLVEDTSFDANANKGMYIERLDDAVFRRVQVAGSGTAAVPHAAGIDINLKFRDYQSISIEDSMITNSGTGDATNGAGIMIKARDDGATYGAAPSTLTGLSLSGNDIGNNTKDGIRLGEIGGANNAGPTDVHINQNNITGSAGFGLNNLTQAISDATCNWWGAADGPSGEGAGSGDAVSTNIDFDPWRSEPRP